MNTSHIENQEDAPSRQSRLVQRTTKEAVNGLTSDYLESADHVRAIMRANGYRQRLSLDALAAAFELCKPSASHEQLLWRAEDFFKRKAIIVPKGLKTLPTCWLRQLPELVWRTRKPHWDRIPYFIQSVIFDEGVLCVSFAQEFAIADRVSAWDRLRIVLNVHLQPNLWCPLPRQLELRMRARKQPKLFESVS